MQLAYPFTLVRFANYAPLILPLEAYRLQDIHREAENWRRISASKRQCEWGWCVIAGKNNAKNDGETLNSQPAVFKVPPLFKGALTHSPVALYSAEARLSVLPTSALTLLLLSPGLSAVTFLYICHQVVAWSQHNGEKHREYD